jgi:hypothetical protein
MKKPIVLRVLELGANHVAREEKLIRVASEIK